MPPLLFFGNCAEFAGRNAESASYANIGVDNEVGFSDNTGNCANGAFFRAKAAAFAFFRIDGINGEVFANMCGAVFILNMRKIFVIEGSKSGDDRVCGALSKGAKGVALAGVADGFKVFKILHGCFAFGDFGKDFEHSLGADSAGRTFSAGFVADEFHIEFCNVDHAVVFVHNDCAAGTHHGTESNKVIEVDGNVKFVRGDAAAGRTAGLDSFEFFAAGNSAADIVNKFAKGGTHGNFNKADVVYFAAKSENFGSFGTGGAVFGEFLHAVSEDIRNGCKGFNVVNNGGFVPKAANCRERRTGSGHTAKSLDGMEKCGFFAANESACAETDVCSEGESGTEDVVAEKSLCFSHFDCVAKTFNRGGIFRTNIEITFGSADCVTCDGHTFDYRKGVILKDGTVHKCAGVALVAVTYNIFFFAVLVISKLPFASGKEAAAASSAKSGFENVGNNFLGSHFKSVCKTLVSAAAESFVEAFGIDYAAAMESDFFLFFIERNLVLFCDFFAGFGVNIKKSFNNFAADNVFFNNFFDVSLLNKAIENVFRKNADERSLGAKAEAAYFAYRNFFLKAFFFDKAVAFFFKFKCAGSNTAAAAADHKIDFSVGTVEFGIKKFLADGCSCKKFFGCSNHVSAASFALYSSTIP